MSRKLVPLLFILIFTPWIIRLSSEPLVLLLTLITTVIFYLLYTSDKNSKNNSRLLILCLVCLTVLQVNTTDRQNLFEISNDDKRYQQEKLDSYPPVRITIGTRTLWIPAGHWFEGRTEYLTYYRFEKNFFENLDLNNYFFASGPRPRVGIDEFEKLPYAYFPFFIYGLFLLSKIKPKTLLLSTIPILLILAYIGNQNLLGPFALFPIIVSATTIGVKPLFEKKKKIYLVLLTILTFLVYVQIISYENFI